MKGTYKEVTRYLDSEYNDYYLEPLAKNKEKTDSNVFIRSASNKISKSNTGAPSSTELSQQNTQLKPFQKTSQMIPLTEDMIREFLTLLGEEALDYFRCLLHIQKVSSELSEAYKDFYIKFQTVPIMFLSWVPGKAVYLWQINRLCPYKKESNHMIVDSKAMKSETKPNLSVLMLAKIVPEEGEEIIIADFIGANEICVMSKIEKNELVMSQYRIKDFVDLTRVNSFKQEVLANDKHLYKLVIKGSLNKECRMTSDITLWKTKSYEELQKEMVTVSKEGQTEENTPISKMKLLQRHYALDILIHDIVVNRHFLKFFRTQNGVSALFNLGTVIAWREDGIFAGCYAYGMKSPPYHTILEDNEFLMRLGLHSFDASYKISFGFFPQVTFGSVSNIPKEHFNGWYGYDKPIDFRVDYTQKNPTYKDSENCVYDVPLSVINPYLVETKPEIKKTDNDNKEYEDNTIKKFDKIENEFRHHKGAKQDLNEDLKSKSKMLKEIRKDISAKITEINKFHEEHTDKHMNSKPKRPNEPECVSRKTMALYTDIKTDIKRKEKEREKKKTQRNSNRNRNDGDY